MGCLKALVVLVALVVLGLVIAGSESRRKAVAPAVGQSASAPQKIKDDGKNPQRLKLINELQAKGIFGETRTSNGVAKVEVRAAFYLLDFKMKASFAEMVFAYWANRGECSLLRLIDVKTGKDVGTFSPELGLDLD